VAEILLKVEKVVFVSINYQMSHIKKRGWRDTKGFPTLEPSGKQEERKTEKQLEKIGNQGSG